MRAIVTNTENYKTYTGDVISMGIGKITLAVTDKKGNKSIKSFKGNKYIVTVGC